MTDEERQKLCAALRNKSDDWLPERMRTDVRDLAADEIERLAKDLEQVESENEHHMRLAFIDAGENPARTWKEEAERLAKENEKFKRAWKQRHVDLYGLSSLKEYGQ